MHVKPIISPTPPPTYTPTGSFPTSMHKKPHPSHATNLLNNPNIPRLTCPWLSFWRASQPELFFLSMKEISLALPAPESSVTHGHISP